MSNPSETTRGTSGWRAALELPPALASLAAFRLTRGALRLLVNRHFRRHPEQGRAWQPLDANYLARPGVLPILLTNAPRWNPHAFIASAGPLTVRQTLHFHAHTARASADSWFLVIYSFPQRRAVGTVSCLNASPAAWEMFTVPAPGRYLIGARYYQPAASALFPAIQVDGVEQVPALPAPPGMNDFYTTLAERTHLFYGCLSYHVSATLRHRRWLPRRTVERVFLPVGNPETRFHYGTIRKGQRLCLGFDQAWLEDYDLYVTVYSRASLPVLWYRVINQADAAGQACPSDGFYLIRLQQRRPVPRTFPAADWGKLVTIRSQASDSPA